MAKAALILAVLLSGCAAQQQRDFCSVSSPIVIGKNEKLSSDTLKQIAVHNRQGEALCGWKSK